MWNRCLIGCLLIVGLTACTPCVVREAQTVVAEADSLRAEGQMYSDSVQLAEACATLGRWQWFYADDYAHACYHYGRLLREKDDPVTAMQVLIRATHSRTHDYHILGRVYSNMGSICHLANDYSLSYDMYQRSADMFLSNGDSLNYYYALNDMAYELAHLRQKDASLDILDHIAQGCSSTAVLTKLLETKAETYLYAQQYDSAIFFAAELYSRGNHEPDGLLIRAQAFSFLGITDSAVYYAQWVLAISNSLSHRNNALYILTNDDELKDKTSIRQTAADRADIQKLLEIRQGKVSQATQLLKQDINRKINLTWLYTTIATLAIVGMILFVHVTRKRKRHQLLSQQISDLETKTDSAIAELQHQIEEKCILFASSPNIKTDLCWNNYDKMCDIVNQHFGLLARKLQQTYHLSEREIRLCVLSLFNMGYDTMADLLYYAPNGIGKFKMRVARKLGTTAKKMRQFLIDIAIDK